MMMMMMMMIIIIYDDDDDDNISLLSHVFYILYWFWLVRKIMRIDRWYLIFLCEIVVFKQIVISE